MGIDDERKHEEDIARRLTLVRGEAREITPHQAPKLDLIVNADRKLMEAVMANDARQVSTWLERGANPNARVPEGWTLLAEAVSALPPRTAIAELLLASGADVRRTTRMVKHRSTRRRSSRRSRNSASSSTAAVRRLTPATRPAGHRFTWPPMSAGSKRPRSSSVAAPM